MNLGVLADFCSLSPSLFLSPSKCTFCLYWRRNVTLKEKKSCLAKFSVSHSYEISVKCAGGRYDHVPVCTDSFFFNTYFYFLLPFSWRHMGYELFLNSIFLHVAAQALAHPSISVLAVSVKNIYWEVRSMLKSYKVDMLPRIFSLTELKCISSVFFFYFLCLSFNLYYFSTV